MIYVVLCRKYKNDFIKSVLAEHLLGDLEDMVDSYDLVYGHVKNPKKTQRQGTVFCRKQNRKITKGWTVRCSGLAVLKTQKSDSYNKTLRWPVHPKRNNSSG